MKKKITLTHDKKLDSDKILEKKATHYDTINGLEDADLTTMIIKSEKTKKISIGIPIHMYQQALGLSNTTGTGYQNILKTAMAIGINRLTKTLKDPN